MRANIHRCILHTYLHAYYIHTCIKHSNTSSSVSICTYVYTHIRTPTKPTYTAAPANRISQRTCFCFAVSHSLSLSNFADTFPHTFVCCFHIVFSMFWSLSLFAIWWCTHVYSFLNKYRLYACIFEQKLAASAKKIAKGNTAREEKLVEWAQTHGLQANVAHAVLNRLEHTQSTRLAQVCITFWILDMSIYVCMFMYIYVEILVFIYIYVYTYIFTYI